VIDTARYASVRRDIVAMVRLIRAVEERRQELAECGCDVEQVDTLLGTLHNGLSEMLPLRRWQPLARRAHATHAAHAAHAAHLT
jgi:hypothetical protein